METASISRQVRWFVLASIGFLLLWQVGTLFDVPRRTAVVLALYGFVLHMVFGKAYSLVPSYFARELAIHRAPLIQFPFSAGGTIGLALAPLPAVPTVVGTIGAVAWTIGVVLFVGALGWSIRDNLAGRQTGTSDANVDRRGVDRLSNAFVPVAIGYLLVGTYETLAIHTSTPVLFTGQPAQATHLLAAGTATVLVFAIGFRLLPRFLVATPPRPLVALVLPTGAIAPLLLAYSLGVGGGTLFRIAAILETIAIVGFALAFWMLFVRSDRRRVGFYSVLIGVGFGVFGVLIGLWFAIDSVSPSLVDAHLRVNLLGFLGLTIIGVAYQFYPPAIGSFPGASDRTARVSIACLAGGLLLEVVGTIGAIERLSTIGTLVVLLGVVLYAYLVVGLFRER